MKHNLLLELYDSVQYFFGIIFAQNFFFSWKLFRWKCICNWVLEFYEKYVSKLIYYINKIYFQISYNTIPK